MIKRVHEFHILDVFIIKQERWGLSNFPNRNHMTIIKLPKENPSDQKSITVSINEAREKIQSGKWIPGLLNRRSNIKC